MGGLILRHISTRQILPILIGGLLVFGYQNCAPPAKSSGSTASTASSSESIGNNFTDPPPSNSGGTEGPIQCDVNNRPTLLGHGPSRSLIDLNFTVFNGMGGNGGDQGVAASAIPVSYFASNEPSNSLESNQAHSLVLGANENDIGGVENVLDLDDGNDQPGGDTDARLSIDIDNGRERDMQCRGGVYSFSVHAEDVCPPQNDNNELRSNEFYNVVVTVIDACTKEADASPTDVASNNFFQQETFGVDVALTSNRAFIAASSGLGDAYQKGAVYAYDFSPSANSLSNVARLIPSDANHGSDGYSSGGEMSSVAADSNIVVAGLPQAGNNDGAAYVWAHDGSSWNQVQRLTPEQASPSFDGNSQWFGQSVAISPNGNVLAIGAQNDTGTFVSQGSVYLYNRSGNTWTFDRRLVATNGEAGDFFGYDVALSDSHLVVGAPGGQPGFSPNTPGKLYSYSLSTFAQTQYNPSSELNSDDKLGYSVDISGSRIIAGAPYYDGDNSDANDDDGRAYLYSVGSSNATNTLSNSSDGGRMGYSVAIDGTDLIVGAPRNASGTGSTYYYKDNSLGSGSFQIRARDRRTSSEFGNAIDIQSGHSLTGAWLMRVGTENEVGKAYLNELNSSNFPWD